MKLNTKTLKSVEIKETQPFSKPTMILNVDLFSNCILKVALKS